MSRNPYAILGVLVDAGEDDVKSAYRTLAKICHPDRGGDPEEFRLLNWAYELLSDPARRAKFDSTGVADDEAPNNTESAITAVLVALLDKAMIGVLQGGRTPRQVDLVATMRLYQQKAQEELSRKKLALASDRQILLQIRERFKYKGEEGKRDVIQEILGARLKSIDGALEMTAKELEFGGLVMKRLLDYSFDVDQVYAPPMQAPLQRMISFEQFATGKF